MEGATSADEQRDYHVTEPSPKRRPHEGVIDERVTYSSRGLPRRVPVKGMQEIDATVVVTVVRGTVWMSIMPPFTWEAIMEPEKVDEVIRTLQLARGEAERMCPVTG